MDLSFYLELLQQQTKKQKQKFIILSYFAFQGKTISEIQQFPENQAAKKVLSHMYFSCQFYIHDFFLLA